MHFGTSIYKKRRVTEMTEFGIIACALAALVFCIIVALVCLIVVAYEKCKQKSANYLHVDGEIVLKTEYPPDRYPEDQS